jgi:hypothetical protein
MFEPKVKLIPKFLTWISNGWIRGITLAPFGIYVIEENLTNLFTINHESIHWKQQLEMIVVGAIIAVLAGILLLSFNVFSWWLLTLLAFPFLFFYLWYLIEWLIRIPINGKAAYRSLSFEREGWENREDLDYLKTRKPFSQLKYMKKAA